MASLLHKGWHAGTGTWPLKEFLFPLFGYSYIAFDLVILKLWTSSGHKLCQANYWKASIVSSAVGCLYSIEARGCNFSKNNTHPKFSYNSYTHTHTNTHTHTTHTHYTHTYTLYHTHIHTLPHTHTHTHTSLFCCCHWTVMQANKW